jgi:hypothetical protein
VEQALWFVLKLTFVQVVMPHRGLERAAHAKGSLIASLVPIGDVLYLFRLKDEGIMFYYGRPVLRLQSPGELPVNSAPIYCILTQVEWQRWDAARRAEVVQSMTDAQGDPLVLIRVMPS